MATLTLVTPNSMTVWGSGSGIVGFELAEVDPDKTIGWLKTADCKSRQVEASTSLISSIASPYGTNPNLYLTAGDWRITALTDFTEDRCVGGVRHNLRATLVIHVIA